VTAVEAIAGGYSPRDELDFARPVSPFLVRPETTGRLVIASGSFRRYDPVADVVESIDARGAARLYRELETQLEKIHREVSWSDESFESILREAVFHLLDTPVPGGEMEVERRLLTYAYSDPELEGLSDAQRQLLRMGPANARTVQAKLRELAAAFDWPPRVTDHSPPILATVEGTDAPAPASRDGDVSDISDVGDDAAFVLSRRTIESHDPPALLPATDLDDLVVTIGAAEHSE
jgi:hypothetical protein